MDDETHVQNQHQQLLLPHNLGRRDDNCKETLLTIVARGDAIITELYRVVEMVPAPFRRSDRAQSVTGGVKHNCYYLDKDKRYTLDDIVCDYSYFKQAEVFEARIESCETLKRADEEFCDNHLDILTRFYLVFESVQRYASDLNQFIIELEDDIFVGQSLESLLLDTESRQLLCEAYFVIGYMLLQIDNSFEGGLRERLIVSYYRYSSYKSSPDSHFDDTCNLMRSTNYRSHHQILYRYDDINLVHNRPQGYPETLLARASVNQSVVNLLIAKLQSVDIYNHTSLAFPHPDHRSAALAHQASMLYVLLLFCPNILKTQRSRMREITDKFFYDNWIISVYMGDLVNLIEAWEPYKAARESLYQLLDVESTKNLANQFKQKFYRILKHLRDYLKEGWLNNDTVLDNCSKILNHIREANIVLKWISLHSQTEPSWQLKLSKMAQKLIADSQPERKEICEFLQDLAILERKFASVHERLITTRDEKIQECKTKIVEILQELICIYTDSEPVRWIKVGSNPELVSLLEQAKFTLGQLDYSSAGARDSIVRIIHVIEQCRETYTDGKCLQVAQMFMDIKENLLKIMRYLSLPPDLRVSLQTIGEFSYAWKIMDSSFTDCMQQVIKDDSSKIFGIESIFLKLASAFDIHMLRIQQVDSKSDLISTSQYYSTKLVAYIRDVLHIMPATILELLSTIISLQTDNILEDVPSKIPLDSLKEYALPEKRFEILELTSKISQYAEGMVKMQNTCIGLIKINSKQLLEEGIRRELVRKLSDSIQETLQFKDLTSPNQPMGTTVDKLSLMAENMIKKLGELTSIMNGFKRSFEYIQDYLFIYGLRMWQEELNRIVKFNVEQANLALIEENSSIYFNGSPSLSIDQQSSIYQSPKAPIPIYSDDPLKSSFIVRILAELLKITNPRETIYDEQVGAWFTQKSQHDPIVDSKVFKLILSSLGAAGLNGLDQMCCTILMLELCELDNFIFTSIKSESPQSQGLRLALQSIEKLRQDCLASRQIASASQQRRQAGLKTLAVGVSKLSHFSDKLINHLLRVGQLQAIRMNISQILSTKCRYEAHDLFRCLETLNDCLMSTLKYGAKAPNDKQPDQRNSSSPHSSQNRSKTLNDIDDISDEASKLQRRHEDTTANSLGDSQLIFELTSQLDWVGLSDPMSKIYTLELGSRIHRGSAETDGPSEYYPMILSLMFLVLLEQSSKFQFSRALSGFIPKQTRSFYYEPRSEDVDGQPLFYGITTLLNHYQPYLMTTVTQSADGGGGGDDDDGKSIDGVAPNEPLVARLLQLVSVYVKLSLDTSDSKASLKPQDLTLEVANMILSSIELKRLARHHSDEDLLAGTLLPEYLLDTFQFTVCHLN